VSVSSWSGGDNGGIAEGIESSITSKILLPIAWDTPPASIFLEDNISDLVFLVELLLSTDFKKLSFDIVV
jgi:hypothetical protein